MSSALSIGWTQYSLKVQPLPLAAHQFYLQQTACVNGEWWRGCLLAVSLSSHPAIVGPGVFPLGGNWLSGLGAWQAVCVCGSLCGLFVVGGFWVDVCAGHQHSWLWSARLASLALLAHAASATFVFFTHTL